MWGHKETPKPSPKVETKSTQKVQTVDHRTDHVAKKDKPHFHGKRTV